MADPNLYGIKQSSKTQPRDLPPETSLAFSSTLSALISSAASKSKSKPAPTSTGRPRPSKKSSSDIFTAHNKNVKKRAAADDVGQRTTQRHKTKDDVGTVDDELLRRARHKMQEKARLYAAMKRGEYLREAGDTERMGLVDFDRKWAERQGARNDDDEIWSSSSGSDTDTENKQDKEELMEYVDEFGRTRKGTKKEAAREERRRRIAAMADAEFAESAARPSMPSNLIYGDIVQHDAFNPDNVVAERMAQIAAKRDRSATPPPPAHYDAAAEVRTRGTGFYTFSKDEEERQKEMEELERQRSETERLRKERVEDNERKRQAAEQMSRAQADTFLDSLDIPGFESEHDHDNG